MIIWPKTEPTDPIDDGSLGDCDPGDSACLIQDMDLNNSYPWEWPGDAVAAGAEHAANSAVDSLSNAVGESVAQVLSSLSTFWMNVPTPAITGSGAGGGGAVPEGDTVAGVGGFLDYMWFIGVTVAVLGLLGIAAQMALQTRRGEGERHLGRIGLVLVAVVLLGASSALIGVLSPSVSAGAGASATVAFLQGSTWYLMVALAVGSVVIAAIKMAWEQRAQPGKDLLRSLLTLVVVSAAGLQLVWLLLRAGDGFADWIMGQALDEGSFADGIAQIVGVPIAGGPLTSIVVIVLGLCVIVTSAIQIVLMLMRGAMLVLLTGVLPLAAAATNTEQGKQWFQKMTAWLLAFILYKPAAALVYATAFTLSGQGMTGGQDESGMVEVLAGLMLMLMAVLTLPALMRFIAPAVGAIGNGGGGATGMAMVGAAALPTGAAMMARGGGGAAAAAAGGGSAGASGAAGAAGASSEASTSGGSSASGAGPAGRTDSPPGSGPGGSTRETSSSGGPSGGGDAGSGSPQAAGAQAAEASPASGGAAPASSGGSGAGGAVAGPAGAAAAQAAQAAGRMVNETAREASETDQGGGPSGSGR